MVFVGKVYDRVLRFKHKFTGGVSWRIAKHAKVIEDYINSDEEVLYAFCAQKNEKFSEMFNTYAVALTNKRLILGRKRILWGSFVSFITPDLYNDMQIYKGLLWGKITIDTVKEVIVLSNLPKKSLDEIETVITDFMIDAKKKYQNEEN